MIQNKQISIWRGTSAPPTLYHIWFKDESQLLRYDDTLKDWVVFLDADTLNERIADFLAQLDGLSVNNKPIIESPVLDGTDLKITFEGNYLAQGQTVDSALQTIDALLTTKVYGE